MSPLDPQVPPAGEEIHLPEPSIQPFLMAVGIALAIVGITVGAALWIPGCVLILVVGIRWIRDTRREMAQLPVEHSSQSH